MNIIKKIPNQPKPLTSAAIIQLRTKNGISNLKVGFSEQQVMSKSYTVL